ncbi:MULTISPECIES: segregation and condensation protein A [Catenibacterium]|mgnify:FL=1|jgi:segregation and condensation protein A|uniref:segregation and condensation protein A n=1 Tax=Catenibacterium TaxID=135858 RepID=UPI0018AC107A|nr:segregation/condensation protein A [Catenibacterium mitsuokai]MBU9056030.1 segregation/condensation protein A [Catenibacterium mitsuokai]MCB5426691.1 segregation/condensation protein A [Catenibacterium mitsuokai]
MEYQVTVDQFTGPLDLLLHLIKEHDMDLLDLDVAAVCDQYLAYIQTMDPSLLEAVSEYLVMAAWLIEMKSKLLLPKPEIDEEDDYEAERKRMIERLIEKNRINGILEAFEASYDKRQTMHSKIPSALEEYLPSGEETIPEGMEVYDLIKAMQRVMQRRALLQPLESKIARVEISIDERTEQIRNYFLRHKDKTVDFEDLFDEGDRYFAIVTFLSILVLVKNSELLITQSGNFEKIYLKGTSYGQE